LISAQVFSDPPLNTAPVTKSGGRVHLGDGASWQAGGNLSSLPDGPYTLGIRAHHITPHQQSGDGVSVEGRVLLTELSGSESVLHFDFHGSTWISQSHGVHPYVVGAQVRVFMDVGRCFLFGADGKLVGGRE
jgi:glycerol transport system ATP-binding protein